MAGHTGSPTVNLADAIADGGPYLNVLLHEGFVETDLFFLHVRLRILISS